MSNINATNSINSTTSTNANKEGKTMNNNTSIFSIITRAFKSDMSCNGRVNVGEQIQNMASLALGGYGIVKTAHEASKLNENSSISERLNVAAKGLGSLMCIASGLMGCFQAAKAASYYPNSDYEYIEKHTEVGTCYYELTDATNADEAAHFDGTVVDRFFLESDAQHALEMAKEENPDRKFSLTHVKVLSVGPTAEFPDAEYGVMELPM